MPSFRFTEAHLQLGMVSSLTQTLLYPNPCNYIQYLTCVSTCVQHYSKKRGAALQPANTPTELHLLPQFSVFPGTIAPQ